MEEIESAERVLDQIIEEGRSLRASDIHLDPLREYLSVRFRVDGVLSRAHLKNLFLHEGMISRIKVLARLPLDDRRLPKDGRFEWVASEGNALSIRVSMMPTSLGENAVLRLFPTVAEAATLTDLGFSQNQRDILLSALAGEGLILVGGSTGSGKTTTLYSLLSILEKESLSIITVEDPVEYYIPGIRQIEVGGTSLLHFGSVLRSILRQDPDVIMIGEIRDNETAEIAIHASLTGHLVLATIHSSSLSMITDRLVYMGISRGLIESALRIALYQKLIPIPCLPCEQKGCELCGGSGINGRTAVVEQTA